MTKSEYNELENNKLINLSKSPFNINNIIEVTNDVAVRGKLLSYLDNENLDTISLSCTRKLVNEEYDYKFEIIKNGVVEEWKI